MTDTLRVISSTLVKLRCLVNEAKHDSLAINSLLLALTSTLNDVLKSGDIDAIVESRSLWLEYVSIIPTTRIPSLASQAEEILSSASATVREEGWISDGSQYAQWLARNAVHLAFPVSSAKNGAPSILLVELGDVGTTIEKGPSRAKAAAVILGKGMSSGYSDDLVSTVLRESILKHTSRVLEFQTMLANLARYEQRLFLLSTLRIISRNYLPIVATLTIEHSSDLQNTEKVISGIVALLQILLHTKAANFAEDMFTWLCNSPLVSPSLLRAAIVVLPDEYKESLMGKSWQKFSDKLSIKHMPILQQEVNSQILLICCNYVKKSNPGLLVLSSRSSTHTAGISEHIGSISPRPRFLGMIVGVAISKLVDEPDKQMEFEFEDDQKQEVNFYLSLVNLNDKATSIADIQPMSTTKVVRPPTTLQQTAKPMKKPPVERRAKITVLNDSSSDGDDDLTPYPKPDFDPEDSDDDPTLIDRDKKPPPVYIRDLVNRLHDTDNFDNYRLALVHGPNLIRRKANFGGEVKESLGDLSTAYLNLHDPFDMSDFHELRLHGLVAILLANPLSMGPLYARSFYSGDYSLEQRSAILASIGMAGRELSGHAGVPEDTDTEEANFPTKTLPERLHKLYSDEIHINALVRKTEDTMLSTSSTRKKVHQSRIIVKNDLARVVAEAFFFPLTGAFQRMGQSATVFKPLLPLLLRTLSLLLTFAGPSAMLVSQMTAELWDLLLSVRQKAQNETSSLEALLFGLLSLFKINEDKRRLAQEHAKEIMETLQWTEEILHRLELGSDSTYAQNWGALPRSNNDGVSGDNRCRALASGLLMAAKEVVDAHNRLMLGDMLDY